MSRKLYENKHYYVTVSSIPHGEMVGQPCYSIVNNDTGIDEAYGFILPEVIAQAYQYSQMMEHPIRGYPWAGNHEELSDEEWEEFDDADPSAGKH